MSGAVTREWTREWTRAAYDAIVLAGGRGSRLGGLDKGSVRVAGRTLLDQALEAAAAAARVVVVGDGPVPEGVLLVREEPVFGGPAAALVAGLRALLRPSQAPFVLVLACDLPHSVEGVPLLEAAVAGDQADGGLGDSAAVDGWCLAGPDGRAQWLLGLYRAAALERAAEQLGTATDRSLGLMLGGLRLGVIPAPEHVTADIDTPEDLQRWTR